MASLAVLQPDPRIAARLTDILTTAHQVALPASWHALERVLAAGHLDGCVVDADHPSRAEALVHIRHLRRKHPGLAIVAFADLDGTDAAAYRFGELGVDAVLPSSSRSDPAGMRDSVERALDMARATVVERALGGRLDADAIRAVVWAVEQARNQPTVAEFARAMVATPRTLSDLLRSWGLPQAGRLLLWGRLLQAAARLTRDEATVESVAHGLGYSTASALARAMKRETGLTPRAVVNRGGLPAVLGILFARTDRGGQDRGRRPRMSVPGVT